MTHLFTGPLDLHTRDALPRYVAIPLVAVLYSIGWGASAVTAIALALIPPSTTPAPHRDAHAYLTETAWSLVLIIVGFVVLRALARCTTTPPDRLGVGLPRRDGWVTGVLLFAMVLVLMNVAWASGDLITTATGLSADRHFPTPSLHDPQEVLALAASWSMYGAAEEFLVMAVPIVALRAARFSWPAIVVTAVVLRGIFHVYYGVAMYPGIILWSAVVALLYIHTGRVWPIFLAHVTNNLVAARSAVPADLAHAFEGPLVSVFDIAVALAVVLGIGTWLWLAWRWFRKDRPKQSTRQTSSRLDV